MPPELENYLLIVPLFLAIAAGWWLGRRERNKAQYQRLSNNMSRDYFAGLDYLLNERTDEAIESFIRALEVNSDTIPAHLALAKLFRRKGDVERAIQIHQNLLARPDLDRSEFLRVQMALARDYYAIGLLDRAENLLLEIIRQRPVRETLVKAQRLLISLYEKEAEWEKALSAADQLPMDERKKLSCELAHYCCEMAEALIQRHQYRDAQSYLRRSEIYDPQGVRSCLLHARIAMDQSEWRQAIKYLKLVADRDPVFVSETLDMLRTCYGHLRNEKELNAYLKQCMSKAPSTSVTLAVAEQVKDEQGLYVAGSFITEELKKRPSVKGFNRLIDMHIEHGAESARDSLRVLRGLTGQLELSKPIYRCISCGFSGKTLHWQCPSCKKWSTTRPIQGLEGE
ncbi:lipopolysaccharide assembly protein LapB [Pontibacterium granulatum]|uniref:lipopolysaccharide assembly protein LapB n=1 Tax=Pontibacterium granulatum TaxID=2036029 RepID=UPI00249CB685|nr:lipopolysaccharide assembly protein LapB [Pontibacterium granulatum]MDI3322752.1 lipopolysaccharide assembly protein LapB [Pontibacterium granulatum]